MNLCKKIICFAMLLLLAAPLCIYTAYIIKQKIIQVQMQEQLEQSNLQTVVVNKADVQWEEVGKEIIVYGELFDVKSYKIVEDKIFFTGLYDKQESTLVKQVEKLQQQKNKNKSAEENLVLKFISIVAILPTKSNSTILKVSCSNIFYSYIDNLLFQNTLVDSPPPIL